MPRYRIWIEYEGTNFYGWQKQPEGRTVENEIEKGISQVFQEDIDVVGQGRTDSGVHAEGQAAHFDCENEIDRDKFLFAMLGVLPRDITVWEVEPVAPDFHARFDAISRQYRYQIVTRPSPLWERYAELVLEDLKFDEMKECAKMILGTHDFESFTLSSADQPGTECTVGRSELSRNGHLITYRIRANRFLRHLARRLTGTMIQVGQGKRSVDEFLDLLHNPNKEISGHGAAAKGLILEKVAYKKEGNLS